ncbi:hypothetical protein [Actinocorallia libanotica]|uniref:Uncharacterized protein n=1 Tax=Actinocorallia libanotica TaxID=46162 RepID=A0ABN1R8X2_9ACTN
MPTNVPRESRSSRIPRSLDRVEDRFILVTVLIVVAGSVLGAVRDWPPAAQLPLIFLALYAVLRNLLPLRGTREEVLRLHDELSAIRAGLDHQCTRFHRYENNAEFYGALREAVAKSAENRLDVWYLRQTPPTDFQQKEARLYFETVLSWARKNPSRIARRLICVNSPQMRRWALDHHSRTGRIPNYEAHVVEWDIRADLLSMAIIDEKIVFLAFSGGINQAIRGMSMEDTDAARYFSDYFNQHWSTSQRLSEWLAHNPPSE